MLDVDLRVLIASEDSIYALDLCRNLTRINLNASLSHSLDHRILSATLLDKDILLIDLEANPAVSIRLIGALRQEALNISIVGLISVEDIDNRVSALDLGADDCVSRHCDYRELRARIRAAIRRQRGQARSLIEVGAVTLDLFKHEVVHGSNRAVLPPQEFALVRLLVERAGTVMSRDMLREQLYGDEPDVSASAIDVLICYIRRKLGKDIIRNIRGRGWAIYERI